MKRFISAVLAVALLLCTLPAAFAASDIENHWAKPYLLELNELGVINPSSEGEYTPDQAIRRWEFMRYINRAFGFTEKASIDFSDVSSSAVYYETVQIAVKYGYINGVGNDKMDPDGTLTREQAATILGRLHKYTPSTDLSKLNSFSDKDKLSNYSKSYVAEAVALGYINGYTDGTFKPQGNITRGEIAKILYYFLGSSLNTSGKAYTGENLNTDTKNVTISAPCSLSDATIAGNLFITEGVLSGSVNLTNVTVNGDIIVSSGNVTLDGTSALHMTVSNSLGLTPQVTCTGNSNIGEVDVQTSAALTESNLAASAGGFADLAITGSNLSLTLDAAVWDVTTSGKTSILTTGSTSIGELTANGETTVTGGGSIQSAVITVSGCELIMKPDTYSLGGGVTAVIAGQSVSASTGVSISPSTLSIDINNPNGIAFSYDFTFNADKNNLIRMAVDGQTLVMGTDYNLLTDKNGIRVYKTYLKTLSAGVHTAELVFADNSQASIGILVGDSALSAVSPSQITFDRYKESPNYSNVTATVVLPAGTLLSSIRLGGTTLERGVDYLYDSSTGIVTFLREELEKKNKGTYTITFVPNKGATFSCTLNVVDTAPVNGVSPAEVDFDSNVNSEGYQDLTITLSTADGANLQKITSNGKTLEEDWQYKINGNQVTISKSAIADLGSNGAAYANLTFVMSNGQNPTLRVNYVTTYSLTAIVVDDLGLPIEGATVTFEPENSKEGSATQNVTTDAYGKATVYVKSGTYTITANHARFTQAVSTTESVSSARTIKLTGEILETVQIVVTNEYGASLPGAIVTIGGQNVTTGADGTASFSLKRGSYMARVTCSGYTSQTIALAVSGTVRERVQLK